jgi:hypothetical protein
VSRRAAVRSSEASDSCKGDERFAVHQGHRPPKLADLLLRLCSYAPLCWVIINHTRLTRSMSVVLDRTNNHQGLQNWQPLVFKMIQEKLHFPPSDWTLLHEVRPGEQSTNAWGLSGDMVC